MIIIGLDDTDIVGSRGTGHLARTVAEALQASGRVAGIVRHQLLIDLRIPYTAKNSSAAILLESPKVDRETLFEQVKDIMLNAFQSGSDPGLAVAEIVPSPVVAFGQRAKREIVTQQEAGDLAAAHNIMLAGLGGTNGGMIGALAAVGLSAGGNDGRYILTGRIRDLSGPVAVGEILDAGIDAVQTEDGQPVSDGIVLAEKLRPARRGGRVVLFVERQEGQWIPLKLD